MNGDAPAIEVRGLIKHFRGRRRARDLLHLWRPPARTEALRGISLSVGRGELVTVLGPNGAGKTTLLKILATLVTPSAGEARVLGMDVCAEPDRVRQLIGYVLADERSFYWRLSCRDNLRFFAALQGLTGIPARRRIEALAALVGVTEQLDRTFMDLSTGQRQRMAIARGLIADPPVLLFDEATRSLDPGRAGRFRTMIRELLVDRGGKAVLLATHDLDEARILSDRVVLMRAGRIDKEGSFSAVESRIREVFAAEAAEEDAEFARLFPDRAPV